MESHQYIQCLQMTELFIFKSGLYLNPTTFYTGETYRNPRVPPNSHFWTKIYS